MSTVPGRVGVDEEDAEFTAEELAEVDAAIEEADLGGGMPADEFIRELREYEQRLSRG